MARMAALVLGLLVLRQKVLGRTERRTDASVRKGHPPRTAYWPIMGRKRSKSVISVRRTSADNIDRIWPEERTPSKLGVPPTGPEARIDGGAGTVTEDEDSARSKQKRECRRLVS